MRIFTAAFAIAVGFIVLLGYFFPAQSESLRFLLIDWAIIIAGVAVLVGNLQPGCCTNGEDTDSPKRWNLRRDPGGLAFYHGNLWIDPWPQHPYMRLAMDAIIIPVEASLMAILAVTLMYASIRLLRRRVDVMSVLFLTVAVVFLIAIMPTPFGPLLGERGNQAVIDFLGTFSQGGTRGLLIGIALGTLLTGLRVLFGIDRPYGGN